MFQHWTDAWQVTKWIYEYAFVDKLWQKKKKWLAMSNVYICAWTMHISKWRKHMSRHQYQKSTIRMYIFKTMFANKNKWLDMNFIRTMERKIYVLKWYVRSSVSYFIDSWLDVRKNMHVKQIYIYMYVWARQIENKKENEWNNKIIGIFMCRSVRRVRQDLRCTSFLQTTEKKGER